jgi:Alr-MurF fusion protein
MSYALSTLAQWLQAPLLGRGNERVDELAYDTRIIHRGENALFIALESSHADGHDFIPEARKRGVTLFLISKPIPLLEHESAILVPNTLKALQILAEKHRIQFSYPVVGVTGSYGKTVVKEWLNQLISPFKSIVSNPRSFNSKIGVPLSVWRMNSQFDLGIFESGISQTDEMVDLQTIIRPTLGIFINLGEAHAKGFSDRLAKAREKAILFRESRMLVHSVDYPEIIHAVNELKTSNPHLQTETFSIRGNESDLTLVKHGEAWSAQYHGFPLPFPLPFRDQASVENAAAALLASFQLGLLPEQLTPLLASLEPVEMRLQQKQAINQCQLINDSYGNTIDGLSVAIDFWLTQKSRPKRTLIVSDLAEAGPEDAHKYRWLAQRLRQSGVERLLAIGPQMVQFQRFFHLREQQFFSSTEDFIEKLPLIPFFDESILLKGARIFGFERIEKKLGAQKHRTVLEVNLDAIEHNFRLYRGLIPKEVKMMVMVKAFAYGSGLLEVAGRLQYLGANYLAVAYADEGVALRKAGITLPILVMNPEEDAFDSLVEYDLEPEVFGFGILQSLSRYLDKNSSAPVLGIHLKLDTGMHRLGFLPEEQDALITVLKNAGRMEVKSLMTHLAAAEDPEQDPFTEKQLTVFHAFADQIEQALNIQPLRHALNTAGMLRHAQFSGSMVRLGIGLYGVDPSTKIQDRLQQVSRLKTILSQIKSLQPGDTVGYGRVGVVKKATRVGTIAIGYADGIGRAFGNGKAAFWVNGKLAPTIGNICMDMCMIDLDGIEAKEGDDVILFGPELPLPQLCKQVGMIPYEMLTGISPRVKRIYIKE